MAAPKLDLKRSTYSHLKVNKLGIRAFVKEDAPKYKDGQAERAKKACRLIYRNKVLSAPGRVIIMDDETYVPVDRNAINGKEFYNARIRGGVADQFRFKPREKFTAKYLVWQAIDENGNVSEAYIQKGTMNGETYLNECLKKRLLPFIERHHPDRNILFWPDMARIHYTGAIVQWLEANGIDFVNYGENAPNVPQARPVEIFWDKCKGEYKRRKEDAKSLSSFKRIWRNISVKVARSCAQSLMKRARRNLRLIGYKGVHAPFKRRDRVA